MRAEQIERLLQHQTELIGRIALGTDLHTCLLAILERLEALLALPSARGSVLLKGGAQLNMVVAPQLSHDYIEHFDQLKLQSEELRAASLGTTGKLDVSALRLDQEGDRHGHLAKQLGFHHAWISPVYTSKNQHVGWILIYLDETVAASKLQREMIVHFGYLVSLAIEKFNASQREELLTRCLRQAHEKVSSLLALLPELLIVLDEHGTLVDAFGGDQSLLPDAPERLQGKHLDAFWPLGEVNQIRHALDMALRCDETQSFESDVQRDDSHRAIENHMVIVRHYRTDQPNTKHVLWMLRDITPQKQARQRIEQLAYFDPLTELPNRRMLMNQTQKVIERVSREEAFGALIYIDLNDFKRINDSLGHYVGDELLVSIAKRLQLSIRDSDTFARIGGDEFVVLLERLQSSDMQIAEEARSVANRILEALKQSFELSGGQFCIGASIGIALIDTCDHEAAEVLKHADAAMYEAKHRSHQSICFHNASLQQRINNRVRVESEINKSLASHDFLAFFQPQLDQHGKLIAAEALVRWQHPEKGLVYPADFLAVAEGMGVMARIQDLMIEQACTLLTALEQKTMLPDDFRIALNICPSQLKDDGFPQHLQTLLEKHGASPSRFVLELTEGMLIDELPRTIALLNMLREMGFRLAIDDFGTGYSSLAYLKRLPMNEIKIDRSFIADIKHSNDPLGIVDSVVSLSEHFKFDVIAEGIEDQHQLDAMCRKSLRGLQGYYLAKPMCQKDFVDWMRAA